MNPKVPTAAENPSGLHQRYIVSKANGEPVDPNAIYFVLRLDDGGDDKIHLECCRNAAREYCQEVFRFQDDNPLYPIADQLWDLLNAIEAGLPE